MWSSVKYIYLIFMAALVEASSSKKGKGIFLFSTWFLPQKLMKRSCVFIGCVCFLTALLDPYCLNNLNEEVGNTFELRVVKGLFSSAVLFHNLSSSTHTCVNIFLSTNVHPLYIISLKSLLESTLMNQKRIFKDFAAYSVIKYLKKRVFALLQRFSRQLSTAASQALIIEGGMKVSLLSEIHTLSLSFFFFFCELALIFVLSLSCSQF